MSDLVHVNVALTRPVAQRLASYIRGVLRSKVMNQVRESTPLFRLKLGLRRVLDELEEQGCTPSGLPRLRRVK